jgi:threonine aldolase
MIDLRSDTVTQPAPETGRAIAETPAGDDVLGDDPTVSEMTYGR